MIRTYRVSYRNLNTHRRGSRVVKAAGLEQAMRTFRDTAPSHHKMTDCKPACDECKSASVHQLTCSKMTDPYASV